VYGHSSGAGVAAHAAAAGLPITRLVLHEPPYGPDDEQSVRSTRALSDAVHAAVADDRPADAIALFLADSGLPTEVIEQMSADPNYRALAATMPYDFAVMGDDTRGGTIPEELIASIAAPTLVLVGGASEAFFRDTAARLAKILPNATHAVLDGQDHTAPAAAVAPAVAAFLTS
jgi:pimeloyl-ACP methyl ester carboxylesterase